MDYIKNLKAKNIGIFDNLEVEFSKNTNIIIGGNSSGKTTILKLLTYCFSHTNLNNTRFRKGAGFSVEAVAKNKKYDIGAENIVDTDQPYRQFNPIRWTAPTSSDIDSTSVLPFNINAYNIFAVGASRYFEYKAISGMKREQNGAERKEFYKSNNSQFLEKPLLPDIKQWMINRYFVVEKEWAKVEKQNWEFLTENLSLITPKNMKFKFSRIERDLEPMFIINNNECYLEELSSGLKSVLAIVFSIIDWIEGVNEDDKALISKATGTILIDEIDAHLHPNWQETIVQDLRKFFPKLQFIFTTHSPHVIASAQKNEIIRIPEHNGTLKIKPSKNNFNSWDIENILDDLMDVQVGTQSQIDGLVENLDIAYDQKNLALYEKRLSDLKIVVHPNDPILKVYEMKKSRLLLK